MKCPLCFQIESRPYHQDKFRSFHECIACSIIFVSRESLISFQDEKTRYDSHENVEGDPGYEAYLKKIVDSSLPYLDPGQKGLDFGCGKTKLVEKLFHREGFAVDSYDLYFHPNESIFNNQYDFIILSEVIEHLREPREVMAKLSTLLSPTGKFLIKTKLAPATEKEFSSWFYKRDITHVQFFNEKSFKFLSEFLGMKEAISLGNDLFLFKK